MPLNTKTFAQLVQDQAAAVQSRAAQILDFTTGSIMRALVEANAAVGLWLQAMALQILSKTRLSTSQGTDVDSWLVDFGVKRLVSTLSSGSVTYSRFTPQSAALIPIGAQVQTADGTQVFQVVIDAVNPAYNVAQNGYLLPIGVNSVTVPVQSTAGTTAANVAADTVTVIATNIIGVDTVTNAFPFAGGGNAETDDQVRARFVNYIGSLSKGTIAAIQYAITSLKLGLDCTIQENIAADGTPTPGLLTITVDDGSGAPPQNLLSTVSAAVAQVRAAGIQWVVLAPIAVNANVYVSFISKDGYDHNSDMALVSAAITNYVASLHVGEPLAYLKLSQIVYEAAYGVQRIAALYLNGSMSDLPSTPRNVISLQSLTVT